MKYQTTVIVFAASALIVVAEYSYGQLFRRRGGNCQVQCANGVCYVQQTAQQEPQAEPEKQVEQEKGPQTPEQTQALFGVDTAKLSGRDGYTVHTNDGRKHISRQEAHRIVGEKLQDDSNKLRITIVGDDGQQKKVLADIQSLARDINDWAVLRGYPPGHWALQPGFVQSGSPTIYCQAPTGKVLHRQDDYLGSDGKGASEQTVEALRKAKTNYDAKKDPDLRKAQAPSADNSKLASYAIAAAAGAGIMHLAKRRKQ